MGTIKKNLVSIHVEQPDDGQHQWPKHVVVIYVIKYLTHSNQLSCVRRTETYYIYCLLLDLYFLFNINDRVL
jgi:hypothetical protein